MTQPLCANAHGFSLHAVSVSANFGVKFGDVSSGVAATFTQSFELSEAQTEGSNTEGSVQVIENFPEQPQTWIWTRQTQLTVFRNDLTELAPITYGNIDQLFIPSGPPTIAIFLPESGSGSNRGATMTSDRACGLRRRRKSNSRPGVLRARLTR